jgi:Tetratricopeptide repeat/zinc-ribbon domain
MTHRLLKLHCPDCGKTIGEDDHLCPHCGTDLDAPPDPAQFEALAAPYLKKAQRALAHGLGLKRALEHCDQAIVYNPASAEAHNLRGLILDGLGKIDQAILAYREALRLDPDFAGAQANLASAEAEALLLPPDIHPPKTSRADKLLMGMGIGLVVCLIAGCAVSIYLVGRPFLTPKKTILYEPDPSRAGMVTPLEVTETAEIIVQRWFTLGYGPPLVSVKVAKNDQIIASVPKSMDNEMINRTRVFGLVEFVDFGKTPKGEGTVVNTDFKPELFPPVAGDAYQTIMTNSDLQTANVTKDNNGNYQVAFTLTAKGAKIMADYTTQHKGSYLGITLDKVVISCPSVDSAITSGSGVIEGGGMTQKIAQDLVNYLQTSPLPYPLK